MTALVVRADAGCLPLPDASVDLIVTSPPYFALRSYTDGGEHYAGQIGAEPTPAAYIDALLACTREWMRVLKPSGSLWVNLGDKYSTYEPRRPERAIQAGSISHVQRAAKPDTRYTRNAPDAYGIPYKSLMGLPWRYAIGCVDSLGLILRRDQIWAKPNGMPESCTDRTRTQHEYWFHLTKEPGYFSAVDAIREPHAPLRKRGIGGYDGRNGQKRHGFTSQQNPAGALPGSVWEIATEPLRVPEHLGVDHFAAFPMEWPRRLILGWSPSGGVVLDPFGGTGATALVADVLGRTGISVDLSADYCRLATWRVNDPSQRAKALRVEKPPAQVDGQWSLFDGAVNT